MFRSFVLFRSIQTKSHWISHNVYRSVTRRLFPCKMDVYKGFPPVSYLKYTLKFIKPSSSQRKPQNPSLDLWKESRTHTNSETEPKLGYSFYVDSAKCSGNPVRNKVEVPHLSFVPFDHLVCHTHRRVHRSTNTQRS